MAADSELLADFESCRLDLCQWKHRDHVRIAFLYASQLGLPAALIRMRTGLQALNAVHGVPAALDRGYHETITVAFLRLIHSACRREVYRDSDHFCDCNPELMSKDALDRYYSRERLDTWEAKSTFLAPDLQPLPE